MRLVHSIGTRLCVLCVAILLISLSSGCTHPELTRRFSEAQWEKPEKEKTPHEYVNVSLYTMNTPEESKTFLYQLSAEGQAAYINEIGKRFTKNEDFYEALQTKQGKAESGTDKSLFHKRLVFSVSKEIGEWGVDNNVGPADRICALKIVLKPCPRDKGATAKFLEWDKFLTAYDTVDLGKITRTQSSQFSMALRLGTETSPLGVQPSASMQEQLAEEVPLKHRYIKMSGELTSDSATLFQEGATGIDLTGTFTVDFTIGIPLPDNRQPMGLVEFENLTKGGRATEADKVQIVFHDLMLPDSVEPIKCDMDYYYTLRHVKRENEREIAEGYHNVEFIKGGKSKRVELVSKKDLTTTLCSLRLKDTESDLSLGYPDIKGSSGPGTMFFKDFRDAKTFLYWLRQTKSNTVANYRLLLGGKALEAGDIGRLYIRIKERPEPPNEKTSVSGQ